MAESDDEFDRRNVREKFRHERNDYERRENRRGREGWDGDRSNWGNRNREGFRDFDRNRRDRFSPPRRDGSSPQLKRMRRDWDDGAYPPHFDGPPFPGGPPLPGLPPPPVWAAGDHPLPPPPSPYSSMGGPPPRGPEPDFPTQPAMMTFKAFLASQDDHISDDEAMKRYNDYKNDFRKQQLNEFFVQHKDEEWFKSKYHPQEYGKRQEDTRQSLKSRCQTFLRLMKLNRIDGVSLDVDRSKALVKLLDAAVILMEGGTEFDLTVLDAEESTSYSRRNSESLVKNGPENNSSPIRRNSLEKKERKLSEDSMDDGEIPPKFTEPLKLEPESADPKPDKIPSEIDPDPVKLQTTTTEQNTKKRNREKSGFDFASGSESESGSLSDSEEDEESRPPGEKPKEVVECQPPIPPTPPIVHSEPKPEPRVETVEAEKSENALEAVEEGEERDEPKPQALHKTLSLFLRNLHANITKQEVEALCKRYPGFLRVALQDPQPERRFLRRGWVTFDRTVNVKEICWNLNNIRLRDCDMGAIVNSELKQRVRPVNGLTVHKAVAKQDIKHAAKIIQNLDNRFGIWDDLPEDKKESERMSFGFVSKNPILKNITDYLVDEGSYEEEVLLDRNTVFWDDLEDKPKPGHAEVFIDRDDELLKVLDRMILYLRIVHSIDYYSTIEYPNEDEMPHRCGIMHARSSLPHGKITQNDLNDWLSSFELRIMPFVNSKLTLEDSEMLKMGKKDVDEEIEKFILANTQELAKDKWLCPLSGKKFKGPEFVRKHIMAKHMDKVEEVKQEVAYFNNFLLDARRPQLPEHPSVRQQLPLPPREGFLPPPPSFPGPPYMLPGAGYRPPMMYHPPPPPRGGPGPYPSPQFANRGPDQYRPRDRFPPRRERARPEPRGGAANYRDLDAPPDVE